MAEPFREQGHVVYTLFDVFGEREQEVTDVEWITEAGAHDLVALTSDERIMRRPAELRAVQVAAVRMFTLTNGNLKVADQVSWFATNVHRIVQRARKPGPYVVGIYHDRIERKWPR